MEQNYPSLNYPRLIDRVQSIFIDVILIIVLMFAFAAILDKFEDTPDWIRMALFFGIWLIYEPLFVSLGCTLGQYIKGIRVRSYADPEKRINFFQALIRLIVKSLLGWISFLTMHMNKEKRAMHDFAAGSIMVFKSAPHGEEEDSPAEYADPAIDPLAG